MKICEQYEVVRELCEALDPGHCGVCWPDPIAWDGRRIRRQARDLLVLGESYLDQSQDFDKKFSDVKEAVFAVKKAFDMI